MSRSRSRDGGGGSLTVLTGIESDGSTGRLGQAQSTPTAIKMGSRLNIVRMTGIRSKVQANRHAGDLAGEGLIPANRVGAAANQVATARWIANRTPDSPSRTLL